MPSVNRQFARISFRTMVGVSAVVLTTIVLAGIRSFSVVKDAATKLGSEISGLCGCGSASVFSTGTMIGGTVLFALSIIFFVMVAIRMTALINKTRKFSSSFSILPLSPKLAVVARDIGVMGAVQEIDAAHGEIFCTGMRRPSIYVSRAAVKSLDEQELRAVLEHERYHLRQRDPFRIFLMDALTVLARFVPGIRRISREYRATVELAADEAVIERLGSTDALSSALLKLIPGRQEDHYLTSAAVTFFSTTEHRIDHLLGQNRIPARKTLVAGFALAGVILAIAVSVASASVKQSARPTDRVIRGQCHAVIRCEMPHPNWNPLMSSEELISTR